MLLIKNRDSRIMKYSILNFVFNRDEKIGFKIFYERDTSFWAEIGTAPLDVFLTTNLNFLNHFIAFI